MKFINFSYFLHFHSVTRLQYGNAETIHNSLEGTCKRYRLDMKTQCVSAGADGASVNFGEITSVMTRLKSDLPWLVPVHCCAHKLELAIKEAFKDSYFNKVITLICNVSDLECIWLSESSTN